VGGEKLDRPRFRLGSVTTSIGPTNVRHRPRGAEQFAGREIDEIYADYFRRIREIAATGWSIACHIST